MNLSIAPNREPGLRASFAATLLFLVPAAPTMSADAGPAPKDHTVFVGTDLSVGKDGNYYNVSGATEDELTYVASGKTEHVRMDSAKDVRVARGVKLSTLTGNITNIQSDVVNRAAEARQFEAMRSSMLLNDIAGDNSDRLLGGVIVADVATSFDASKTYDPAASQQFIDATRAAARENFSSGVGDSIFASTLANNILIDRLNIGSGETIELSFQVSSPQPLDDAYVVVLANYAAPNKPNEVSQRITARKLGHIDSKPRTVRLAQLASVNGLEFKKFDFALFADGQELATNLSKTQTQITADDAYTFFRIDYLAAHEGETLPPMPMLMIPRSELRRIAPADALDQTIYARVDKSGATLSLSLDPAGKQNLPDDVEKAFEKVRFVPAIEKGVPVDGQARIKLAQLIR